MINHSIVSYTSDLQLCSFPCSGCEEVSKKDAEQEGKFVVGQQLWGSLNTVTPFPPYSIPKLTNNDYDAVICIC